MSGATDGVDPLNAAHVQSKYYPDVRNGSLTFSNGAPILTGATLKIPFLERFESAGGIPVGGHTVVRSYPFPMITLQKPTIFSVNTIYREGVFAPSVIQYAASVDQALNSYNNQRSIGLEFIPLYAGGILATAMTSGSPSSINVGDAANFQEVISAFSYGWIQIDSEIMQFTGTTATNLTGIGTRGAYGTIAASHNPGALVRLLVTDWKAEGQILLSGF
jgi:hypothetical protein